MQMGHVDNALGVNVAMVHWDGNVWNCEALDRFVVAQPMSYGDKNNPVSSLL